VWWFLSSNALRDRAKHNDDSNLSIDEISGPFVKIDRPTMSVTEFRQTLVRRSHTWAHSMHSLLSTRFIIQRFLPWFADTRGASTALGMNLTPFLPNPTCPAGKRFQRDCEANFGISYFPKVNDMNKQRTVVGLATEHPRQIESCSIPAGVRSTSLPC